MLQCKYLNIKWNINYYYRIRHPKEKRSKSSVIPSKILAPDNVEILHTIDVPDHIINQYILQG
jgi:hypothetical protein